MSTIRSRRLDPAALAGVMSRDVVMFRRYWKATTFSSVVQPTIYLLAFGLGFGSLVSHVGHVKYVQYVATGVVATAVLFSSAFPGMFNTFIRWQFQRTYDAILAAGTRGCDVLLVDTAGRLHTKYNLMEELKKINKVIQKLLPDGPHELIMVIDATTGQNALLQARKFAEDIGLTGVIITKLDSTAKGGFAFAVADDLGVPIKFIGTGEKVADIIPFNPQDFVAALLAQD